MNLIPPKEFLTVIAFIVGAYAVGMFSFDVYRKIKSWWKKK